MLVSSYYLISYQYYTKLYLRNTSDEYAVIIWNIKTCIGQNVFVTLNTHTCGDVVLVNYFKNWINALKASMHNLKTMCWKKSDTWTYILYTMHTHTHAHTHTQRLWSKAHPVHSYFVSVGRIRLLSWNNHLHTTFLAQPTVAMPLLLQYHLPFNLPMFPSLSLMTVFSILAVASIHEYHHLLRATQFHHAIYDMVPMAEKWFLIFLAYAEEVFSSLTKSPKE